MYKRNLRKLFLEKIEGIGGEIMESDNWKMIVFDFLRDAQKYWIQEQFCFLKIVNFGIKFCRKL